MGAAVGSTRASIENGPWKVPWKYFPNGTPPTHPPHTQGACVRAHRSASGLAHRDRVTATAGFAVGWESPRGVDVWKTVGWGAAGAGDVCGWHPQTCCRGLFLLMFSTVLMAVHRVGWVLLCPTCAVSRGSHARGLDGHVLRSGKSVEVVHRHVLVLPV